TRESSIDNEILGSALRLSEDDTIKTRGVT
ncbi:MAG: hypothetical protein ACD_58C00049G0004, partial [uncultured bacterium]